MSCSRPLAAWQLTDGSVVFSSAGSQRRQLRLPCGQCRWCRLERSRQWAVRCLHEASLYESNCFLTLTYDDDHLPDFCSLDYSHFQLFMKRLRRRFASVRIRFYMCGEYGDQFGRPHFHACLFNFDFPDKVYLSLSPGGSRIYRSAVLEALWPFGFSSVGSVTFESAAYVARYCMKKITGPMAEAHYEVVDPSSGEIVSRVPEFNHMSLKPGIGAKWISRFKSDVYPHGKVVVNGVECVPPRYYDKFFARVDPEGYALLLERRSVEFAVAAGEHSAPRLAVKDEVLGARLSSLKRVI